MSIYEDPRAVDQLADQFLAEEAAEVVRFETKLAHVVNAISRVEDHQTQLALMCLLAFVEQEIKR